MHDVNVLARYARLPDPATALPPNDYLTSDEQTLTIFDKYPKSRYHFLILPRLPFLVSGRALHPEAPLDNIRSLLGSATHSAEVLKALRNACKEVTEMIRDEMEKTYGRIWGVQAGFHAQESKRHVHLHVMSDDFDSPALKKKRHWNSFRADLGFWLPLDSFVVNTTTMEKPDHYAELLRRPLEDPRAGMVFRNIPQLKEHLARTWKEKNDEAKKDME